MRRRAGPAGGKVELAGLRLGELHQFRHRARRHRGVYDQDYVERKRVNASNIRAGYDPHSRLLEIEA